MKTVQQIMQETNAEANIQDFRYMQQHYTYEQKVRHAENVAASFEEQCRARGLNCHVSVGGLDSITLHYFLEECGISVPCVSCSTLEQKGVQAVHKQIAAEMEARSPAGEWLGGHMALPRALQREDTALALMLGMAAESVILADKMALYRRALERIEEKYALHMGNTVTFAQFRARRKNHVVRVYSGRRCGSAGPVGHLAERPGRWHAQRCQDGRGTGRPYADAENRNERRP